MNRKEGTPSDRLTANLKRSYHYVGKKNSFHASLKFRFLNEACKWLIGEDG